MGMTGAASSLGVFVLGKPFNARRSPSRRDESLGVRRQMGRVVASAVWGLVAAFKYPPERRLGQCPV